MAERSMLDSDLYLTRTQNNKYNIKYQIIMKTFRRFLFIIFMVSVPAIIFGQEKSKSLNTVKFLTSIDCDACVNTIMGNLPKEKGIKDVKCDLKTREVTVTYQQDKTDPELVQRNIEKLGYTAKPVKEEVKPAKK